MDNSYRAARRFEMMFPNIAYQEHLRSTDPERYEQHMNNLRSEPIDTEDSELIAIIVYDPKSRKIRIEKPKEE